VRASTLRILGRRDTPAPVARALARRTLAGLRGASLSVLDPSCGAGPLLEAAAVATKGRAELTGIDKDPVALDEARAALGDAGLEAILIAADALEGSAADLLELLGRPGGGGFDAVLANPPWVSFSGREAVRLSKRVRASLRARFESFGRWPALQGPFLERALELVRPGGRVGFVLPRQVLDLDGYAPLRRVATGRARLLEVRDLGEDVFEGVCEPTATVVLERADDPLVTESSPAPWLPSTLARRSSLPSWAARTLARLARFPRFPRELLSDPGVHTGNAADIIIRDEPARGFVPCREGREVRPFELALPRRFVAARPELARPLYARVAPLERFLEASVLVRQTADRPIAARHEPRAAFRNSALAVRAPEGFPVEVVLALLNSRAFALDHRARTADARQRSFPQVKVSALAALAFPARLPERAREAIVALVHRRELVPGPAEVRRLERELERAVAGLFGIDADAVSALGEFFP
jgi:hypothetical protein